MCVCAKPHLSISKNRACSLCSCHLPSREMLHFLSETSLLFLVTRRLPVKGQYTAPTDFHSLILLVFLHFARSRSPRVTVAYQLPFSLSYWPKCQRCMQQARVRFCFFSQLKAILPDVQIFSLFPHMTFHPSLFGLTFPFPNRSMWTWDASLNLAFHFLAY